MQWNKPRGLQIKPEKFFQNPVNVNPKRAPTGLNTKIVNVDFIPNAEEIIVFKNAISNIDNDIVFAYNYNSLKFEKETVTGPKGIYCISFINNRQINFN